MESEPEWRDPSFPPEWRTLAVGGSSKGKERRGHVGEWSALTFRQRRRLLELNPGKQGKPRLFAASRANIKKGAEMFRDNPCGFRSARWGDDETGRNSGVIARSCHCLFFPCHCHATIKKERRSLLFQRGARWQCSLIYFSSEVRSMEMLFIVFLLPR